MRSTDKIKYLRSVAAAVFWIIIWWAAAASVGQELILPSPIQVAKRFVVLCGEKDFWMSAMLSLGRILSGLAVGIVIGTLLASFTAKVSFLDVLFSPILRLVRATPVASFIILALLWLGRAQVPGFISSLIVIPVVCGAVQSAIRETDKNLLEMSRAYRFGKLKTVRLIYIPSVLPSWTASCITSMGLAWKAGIAAEVICQPKMAVGTEIYNSRTFLETTSLFAWTALVIILSYMIETIFVRLMKGRVKI